MSATEVGMSKMIVVDLIDPSPWAALFPISDEDLGLLVADIKERGIQTPLHVYPRDNRYELLAGHSRLEAARRAGLSEVPCVMRTMLNSEDDRFAYFLRDNTLRKTVSKADIAAAVWRRYPDKTVKEISATAGVSVGLAHQIRKDMEASGTLKFTAEIENSRGQARPRAYRERTRPPARKQGVQTGDSAVRDDSSNGDKRRLATPSERAAERWGVTVDDERRAAERRQAVQVQTDDAANDLAEATAFFKVDEIVVELEHAHRQISQLEAELESLTRGDLQAEVRSLHKRCAQLEVRVKQESTTSAAAQKQAQYAQSMLKKIRSILGVEKNSQILPAFKSRLA
jgi:ParB/RepB/Spo0J family partition protein